jgi:hypothetical protein
LRAQVEAHTKKRGQPWTKDTIEFRKALHYSLETEKRELVVNIERQLAAIAALSLSPVVLIDGKDTQKAVADRRRHWANIQRYYAKWYVPQIHIGLCESVFRCSHNYCLPIIRSHSFAYP